MMNRTLNRPSMRTTMVGMALTALLSACGGGGGGSTPTPAAVTLSTLAAGGGSTCRIDGSSGALSCWGMNDFGQLGSGTAGGSSATAQTVSLGAGRKATAVALGVDHTCAILDDQSVACWGSNAQGQIGQPANLNANPTPTLVPGLKAQALSLGIEHSCAVTLTGSVQCWGSNSKGQLGVPATQLTQSATPQIIGGLSNIKALVSGFNFVCALTQGSTVQCWGDNQSGQLGNASTIDSAAPVAAGSLSGVQALAAGAYHACATTGTAVSCWGRNDQGQLDGRQTFALAQHPAIDHGLGPVQRALPGVLAGQAAAVGLDLFEPARLRVPAVGAAAHQQVAMTGAQADLAQALGAAPAGDQGMTVDALLGRRGGGVAQVQVAAPGHQLAQGAHGQGVPRSRVIRRCPGIGRHHGSGHTQLAQRLHDPGTPRLRASHRPRSPARPWTCLPTSSR